MPTRPDFKAPWTRSFAAAVVGYFSFAIVWGGTTPWLAPFPSDPPFGVVDLVEGVLGGLAMAIIGLILVVGAVFLALAVIWARLQLWALQRMGGAWWAQSITVGVAAGLAFGWMFWSALFSGFRAQPLPDLVAGVVAGGIAGFVLVWVPPTWRQGHPGKIDRT